MKTAAHIGTLFKRELAAYFNVAIAYIFIIVFVLLNGGLFMTPFFLSSRADMQSFFVTLPFLLAVFLPAVTMRQWAEEKKGNTLELLLTFPMQTHELVLGKFFAGLIFYFAALAGTLTVPVMLRVLGYPDGGAIFGGYLGSALLGAFFLAAGIFISGLVRDQIVAFILSMMACFGLYLLGTEFIAASIDGWLPGIGTFLSRFVGAAGHFGSFARGVADMRDILYFVIGTVLCLVLNGFWMEGRMRPRAGAIFTAAAAISAGIFLMSNWFLSEFSLGRFDLTEGKIYTISPVTKKILQTLKAPVTVKFYVSPSEKMPAGMKTLEQDVVGKLDELKVAGRGNFQYKIFHMEAANVVEGGEDAKESLEETLQSKGISPFQVQSIESDEVGVRLVYAAISLAYKEKPDEILPRIMPDSLYELEYLVMSKIFRMTLAETPKIALLAPYEDRATDPALMALFAQLGQQAPGSYRKDEYELLSRVLAYEGYDVSRMALSRDDKIPDGIKTLVVIEPSRLEERQRFEIGRFLRAGGSVFMAVQNYDYDYDPTAGRLKIFAKDKQPEVNPLLEAWGLAVDRDILADRQSEVINLSGGAQFGPFALSVPVELPIQILIPPAGMNQDLSLTSRLSSFFYLWGSALKIDEKKIRDQKLNLQVLLRSSRESWTVPFEGGPMSPRTFNPRENSPKGPFPLAVFVQGQFADPYEGKKVPDWPAVEEESPAPENPVPDEKDEAPAPVKPAPGKLILTGAATMFQKQLAASGGHLNFFINSMDVLTLGEDLVHIRSKRPIDRTINRVSSAQKVFWRFFVMLLVPVIVTLTGFGRILMRQRAQQKYLGTLTAK